MEGVGKHAVCFLLGGVEAWRRVEGRKSERETGEKNNPKKRKLLGQRGRKNSVSFSGKNVLKSC